MNDTALLVIDVQQSFEHRPFWSEADLPAFRDALTRLITGAVEQKVPVVRILHVSDKGPFSIASGWVRPMDWVPDPHDVVFHKRVHNAFTDTQLGEWLRERGLRRLIVSGIRTEQCCETTTRVGSDLGYPVDFVTEATLTFPMTHPLTGRTLSAAELKERTELVLVDRFATLCSVDQALARATGPR
jgi:nicotinamidase-related amidase